MMNKKGEDDEKVESNVLGLILSLIILVLIIFGVYKGIIAITNDPEPENAHAALQRVVTKLNALSETSSVNYTFQGFKQKKHDWFIMGWGKNQDGRPDKCFLESCICVCPGADANSCQNNGQCIPFSQIKYIQIEEINIKAETKTVGLGSKAPDSQSTGNYILERKSAIPIPENIISVEIIKSPDKLILTHYTADYFAYKNKIK